MINIFLFLNILFAGNDLRPLYVPGELIVKYKNVQKIIYKNSLATKDFISINKKTFEVMEITDANSVEEMVAELTKDENVEMVTPNYYFYVDAVPTSSQFASQWAYNSSTYNINIKNVWDEHTDCSVNDFRIAIIDTGINKDHLDLKDFLSDSLAYNGYTEETGLINVPDVTNGNPARVNGHGTHIAGIITADSKNKVTGLCWKSKLIIVKAFNETGQGSFSAILKGLNFAIENGAKVINMSFGGEGGKASYESIFNSVEDVMFVAAAGNDGRNMDDGILQYPCAVDSHNLICVANVQESKTVAASSNYGNIVVDIGAPGSSLLSTYIGSEIATMSKSGTSMASPVVAGAVALLMTKFPELSIYEIKSAIMFGGLYVESSSNYTSSDRFLDVGLSYEALSNNDIILPPSKISFEVINIE